MKQTIVPCSFFLLFLMLAGPMQAQVTITQNDYPRAASFTDSLIKVSTSGLTLPTEGANQVWDYSSLATEELVLKDYFDATADADFPDALNFRERDLIFQGFLIPSNAYEAIDENGWYDYGKSVERAPHSITALTGGPNDSLVFLADADIFEGRINLLQFPMTYQDQWSGTHIERTNFELTVAAFGLNQTPGTQKRYLSNVREVVGYGQLIIPQEDGMPSAPMDVLLIKVTQTTQDSFFLAGAPAPAVLLSAFGISQGITAADSFYLFYKPGFAAPVLDLDIVGNQAGDSYYRPQAAEITSAIQETTLAEAICFPNPVVAGQSLSIQLEDMSASGFVNLVDMYGRVVYQQKFDAASANQVQLSIPEGLGKGIHLLLILDERGFALGQGKVQIR